MNTVISEKQARQITGGRTPLVPIEYEQACAELEKCINLDEAKYWSDKADALAAWAMIYRDDKAGATARRVKLKAYDRMGALARELRPLKFVKGHRGAVPGPAKLLASHGLNSDQAAAALAISRAPRDKFGKALDDAIGINRARTLFRGHSPAGRPRSSDAWVWLTDKNGGGPNLHHARAAMRSRPAREVAAEINSGEAKVARALVVWITEWLDEFEQYLPKDQECANAP